MFILYDNYTGKNKMIKNEKSFSSSSIMKFSKMVTDKMLQRNPRTSFRRNLYFQEMKPIFIMLRVIGRFPYGFTNTGFHPFSLISWPFLYSCVYNLVFYSLTIWALNAVIREKLCTSKSYDETLYWCLLILFSLQSFTVPFTFWLDAPNTVQYFQMWKELEEFWTGDPLISDKRCRIVKNSSLLVLPSITMFIILEGYLMADMSLLVFVPYIPILTASTLMLIHWCWTLYELTQYSEQLLKEISKGFQKPEIGYKRRTWLKISKLVSEIGHATGRSGLCFLISIFVAFLLSTYGTLVSLTVTFAYNTSMIGLILASIYCFIYIYILSAAAHRATEQSGPNFLRALMQIDVSNSHPMSLNEVDLLIKCIATKYPVIEYLGFVKLNSRTFAFFISSTVTYLIVLLQFKSNPQKYKKAYLAEESVDNTTSYSTLLKN